MQFWDLKISSAYCLPLIVIGRFNKNIISRHGYKIVDWEMDYPGIYLILWISVTQLPLVATLNTWFKDFCGRNFLATFVIRGAVNNKCFFLFRFAGKLLNTNIQQVAEKSRKYNLCPIFWTLFIVHQHKWWKLHPILYPLPINFSKIGPNSLFSLFLHERYWCHLFDTDCMSVPLVVKKTATTENLA